MSILKHCNTCDQTKPIDSFAKHSQKIDGHMYTCKDCRRAKHKTKYDNDPDYRASYRNSKLKHKYGIDIDEYEALMQLQAGGCAICGGLHSKGLNLVVDHDHQTGEVRGLLCDKCNSGIGLFGDDITKLRLAIRYLELGGVYHH